RDLALMTLMGAAMALFQICYFTAIRRVGVSVAAMVTYGTTPVVVASASAAFLRDRLSRSTVGALLCALVGLPLLLGVGSGSAVSVRGATLAACAGGSYGLFTLLGRAVAGRYSPLQPVALSFTAAAVLLLPFALATGFQTHYPLAGWLLLLHLGLV